jgi:hypothetical protein
MTLTEDLRAMADRQEQVLNVGSASILREAAHRILELEMHLNSMLAFSHPSYDRPEAAEVYCKAFKTIFGEYPAAWKKLKAYRSGSTASKLEPDWIDGSGKIHSYKCGLNPDPKAMKHMVSHCTCSTAIKEAKS